MRVLLACTLGAAILAACTVGTAPDQAEVCRLAKARQVAVGATMATTNDWEAWLKSRKDAEAVQREVKAAC